MAAGMPRRTAFDADAGHRVDQHMRTGDDRQRRLEPFSPASPAEKSLAQPGIRARGSSTSTLPPARTIAANAGLVQRPADRHRGHGGTGLGQTGRRVQTVATVVPGTGEHHDAAPSDRSMPSSSSRRAAISATAPAAMRISGTPSSSRGAFQSAHRGGVIRRVKQCFAAIRILIRYHARPLSHPYRLDTTLLRPHQYRRTRERPRPPVPADARRRTPCAEYP